MKLVLVIGISSLWICSGSILRFGWDLPQLKSASTTTTESKPHFATNSFSTTKIVNTEAGYSPSPTVTSTFGSTSKQSPDDGCGCVRPERCGKQPGIDGPRQDQVPSQGLRFEFISPNYSSYSGGTGDSFASSSSNSNRIVNKCPDGEGWCCNIFPPSPKPETTVKPEPEPDRCGINNYIQVPGYQEVEGQASFGEYPWLALILAADDTIISTGVLIDNQNVLTVAHRLFNSQLKVAKIRLGEWNFDNNYEPYKFIDVPISWTQLHQDFNELSLKNDIAIIRLATYLQLNTFPHINKACLPRPGDSFTGRRCWVAGYGEDASGKYPSILREVLVPVLNGDKCQDELRKPGTGLGSYFSLDQKSFICAGGEKYKDACTGDGGSGLICQDDRGRAYVAGLVSWGLGCAQYPGVYVNVPSYIQWIRDSLAN